MTPGKYLFQVQLQLLDGTSEVTWFSADSQPDLARKIAEDDAVSSFEILRSHRAVV